jgi:hypothetical protein
MKLYDTIKRILTIYPQTRNSDKLLISEVFRSTGAIHPVTYFGQEYEAVFLNQLISGKLPSYESITRARRKVQEVCPELQATSEQVRSVRHQKQSTRGTFIYREEI